jgi:energy-coupling factor transporter ATP-binding protein EcfA2
MCQPLRLSIAVIGSNKSGKSSLIRAFARLLMDQEGFYQAYKEQRKDKTAYLGDLSHGGGSKKVLNNRISADFNF